MSDENVTPQTDLPSKAASVTELAEQARRLLAPHFSSPEALETAVAGISHSATEILASRPPSVGVHRNLKLLRHYPRFVSGARELLEALEAQGIYTRDDLVMAILDIEIPSARDPGESRWLAYRKAWAGTNFRVILNSLDVIDMRQLPSIVFRPMAKQIAAIAKIEPEIAYKSVVDVYMFRRTSANRDDNPVQNGATTLRPQP